MNPQVSQENIDQWKSQHGDVYQVKGENEQGEEIICYFRKPGRADLARFTQELTRDMFKATNNFVFNCLLHPDPEVLRKMADDKPGIILALGGELQKIIGSSQDFLSTKL
jgi:hypothetical protein